MKLTTKTYGLVGIVFAVILFAAVNIFGNTALIGARLDLTSEKIYTLSQGTKNILKNLEEPVRIRYFYSRETATGIPYIQSYAARVEGLLRQYAGIAGSNVVLDFINPEPFSPEEDLAVSFGIQAVPINERGDKIYFGMSATNSVDDTQAIPFFDPQREAFLEYDLTKMIYDLANPKKPVIGLISSYNMKTQTQIPIPGLPGLSGETWTVMNQIKNNFDVEYLEQDIAAIPEDIDILMVVHPQEVTEDALYAIDQYVLSGGKAMVFVDPYSEGPPSQEKSSNLDKLFATWGISMPDGMVVADRMHGVRVQTQAGNSRLRAIDKLNWLALPPARLNSEDVVTGELKHLRVASSGHIVEAETEGEKPKWTPLVSSSEAVMEVSSSDLYSPETLLQNFKPSGQPFTIAGRLHGTAVSAFPDKEGNDDHLVQSSEPINVIVFADTDLLRDEFWMQKQRFFGNTLIMQVADNASFVMNALDNLSGSSDLISLRSRSKTERPFTVVADLRRQAEAKFLEEEQRLQNKLQETEVKLAQLRSGGEQQEGAVLLSQEQQKEIEKFQQEIVKTRQSLRDVQHSLRKDIEGLGNWLKFINIGLFPILVIMLSFFIPAQLGIRKA